MTPDEVKADIAELRELSAAATRVRVKNSLLSEIARLEKELATLAVPAPLPPAAASPNAGKGGKKGKKGKASAAPAPPKTPSVLPLVRLTSYALDQSIKFLKIYVNFERANSVPESSIKCDIQESSVYLYVADFEGKNYEYKVDGLLRDVDPAESKFKLKEDSILLMLKKQIEGEEWDAVTKVEHFTKAKFQLKQPDVPSSMAPQAGMMKMMKDMYANGDDEMKRQIKKAMWENQKGQMKK